jgi:hypothetical protein
MHPAISFRVKNIIGRSKRGTHVFVRARFDQTDDEEDTESCNDEYSYGAPINSPTNGMEHSTAAAEPTPFDFPSIFDEP